MRGEEGEGGVAFACGEEGDISVGSRGEGKEGGREGDSWERGGELTVRHFE